MLDPLQFYCKFLCNGMKKRFRMVMIAHHGPGIGFNKRFMWRIIIPPTTCTCILNPATFLHLDVSICPCQPSWRTFSSQTSPSGTTFPMGGVLSMCPPHPPFIFQLLHIHAHPLQPTWPLGSVPTCAPFHTPPHTLHTIFSWVFLIPTPLPVPGTLPSLSHGPWVGKFFFLGKTPTVIPRGL